MTGGGGARGGSALRPGAVAGAGAARARRLRRLGRVERHRHGQNHRHRLPVVARSLVLPVLHRRHRSLVQPSNAAHDADVGDVAVLSNRQVQQHRSGRLRILWISGRTATQPARRSDVSPTRMGDDNGIGGGASGAGAGGGGTTVLVGEGIGRPGGCGLAPLPPAVCVDAVARSVPRGEARAGGSRTGGSATGGAAAGDSVFGSVFGSVTALVGADPAQCRRPMGVRLASTWSVRTRAVPGPAMRRHNTRRPTRQCSISRPQRHDGNDERQDSGTDRHPGYRPGVSRRGRASRTRRSTGAAAPARCRPAAAEAPRSPAAVRGPGARPPRARRFRSPADPRD